VAANSRYGEQERLQPERRGSPRRWWCFSRDGTDVYLSCLISSIPSAFLDHPLALQHVQQRFQPQTASSWRTTLLPGTLAGFPFVEEERAASPRVAMITGKNVEREDNQEGKTEGGCRRHPEPQGSHCRRQEGGQGLGAHRCREIISCTVA
jgi:hypothetical protein